jgi:stalled ribosome alternative rescue factor ArfA
MKKATRNMVALDLASRKYALRIVAKAKGKGSYRRTEKHRTWKDVGASSVFGTETFSHCGEIWADFL